MVGLRWGDVINELDIVRVVKLIGAAKDHLWPDLSFRAPEVGDEGTVVAVHVLDGGLVGYTVEFVNSEGGAEWLADFLGEELMVVEGR